MVPIEMYAPHSYSTSKNTIGQSCTVWPQYTTLQITDDIHTEQTEKAAYAIASAAYKLRAIFILSVSRRCHTCIVAKRSTMSANHSW